MDERASQDQIDNCFRLQDFNSQLPSVSRCRRNRELFQTLDRIWLTTVALIYSFRIVVLPGDGIGASPLYDHH